MGKGWGSGPRRRWRGRRSRAAGGALAAALLVVTAACGGNGGSQEDAGDAGVAGEADAADPRRGGTLRFALEGETSGGYCIPEGQLAASGINVHNAVYDPLFAFDADYEPAPWLAESLEVSDDATSFRIRLRDGVTFHDDTPLDARVVKLNLDAERGEPSALAATGRRPLLGPLVLANIASVEVVDPLTVEVRTKSPWPAFPTYLASGRFGIAAEAQLTAADCAERLIGTGPFRLVSWDRNEEMVLERNPAYWRTGADGEPLPYLDRLVFTPVESSTGRLQSLEAGTVDAGHWSQATLLDDLERAGGGIRLIREAAGHREVGHLLLNVGRPPLNDPEVRRHLALAIDREALREVASGGLLEPADQPFDRDVLGYRDDAPAPEHDPEAAAAFFADRPVTLVLPGSSDPVSLATNEELRRQLGVVGVEVQLVTEDQSTLINRALQGDFDLTSGRNYPGQDPDSNYVWWRSGQPTNFGRIADPALDQALDDGRSGLDPQFRQEAYERVAERLTDGRYVLWNWYSEWGFGAAGDVHQLGYYSMPDGSPGAGATWGWTYWGEVWVDPEG